MTTNELALMSDDALLTETKRVADVERRSMADLLTLLIEVERRELCERLGYSSLFAYCTKALGLSEQAAYSRITAARAVRRFPAMLPMLGDGALTLSSVGVLAPHLTDENQEALLEGAKDRSTRDVQKLVADVHPQPHIPTTVRALPTRNVVAPLAPARYLVRVTVGKGTYDKLERAKNLLRHAIPSGDLAEILDRALTLLLHETERTKLGATTRPRSQRSAAPGTRHVPAAVRRAVWARDQGRCAYVGLHGRCDEAAFFEFHHVIPFGAGGPTTVENLQLRCRRHNAHEARASVGARQAAHDAAAN